MVERIGTRQVRCEIKSRIAVQEGKRSRGRGRWTMNAYLFILDNGGGHVWDFDKGLSDEKGNTLRGRKECGYVASLNDDIEVVSGE